MRRFDSSTVIRQRMLRLKKRKNVLRRQRSLREKMLLTKQEFHNQLEHIREPFGESDRTKLGDQ